MRDDVTSTPRHINNFQYKAFNTLCLISILSRTNKQKFNMEV